MIRATGAALLVVVGVESDQDASSAEGQLTVGAISPTAEVVGVI